MRLLDTNVRALNYKSFGVPSLTNAWGSLVGVLDACLVTGLSYQTITSYSTISDPLNEDTYWLTTLFLNIGHSFEKDLSVIEIKDCPEIKLNGLHRVQEIDTYTIKIATLKSKYPQKPNDSSPGVECSIRLPPLGYKIDFQEDFKRVYRTANIDNHQCYLRVDNDCPEGFDATKYKFARVSIFDKMENLYDIYPRTGRLKAPYYPEDPIRAESQTGTGTTGIFGESKWYYSTNSGGYPTESSSPSSSGPFEFDIVGDDKTFYFIISVRGYSQTWQKIGYCFGEYTGVASRTSSNSNFTLCATEAYKQADDNSIFSYTSNPGRAETGSAFGRANNTVGKYFLNSEYDGGLINKHIKGSFFSLIIGSYSGRDTGFTYSQFNKELVFAEVYLRLYYLSATILGGKMRGYHFVGGNISSDTDYFNPRFKDIFNTTTLNSKEPKKLAMYNIFHSKSSGATEDTMSDLWVAFSLNNWE